MYVCVYIEQKRDVDFGCKVEKITVQKDNVEKKLLPPL